MLCFGINEHRCLFKYINPNTLFSNLNSKDLRKKIIADYGLRMIDNFKMDQIYNEELYCLAYSSEKQLLGCLRVSEGSHDSCNSDYRKIFTFLLLIGAEKFKISPDIGIRTIHLL